MVRYKVREMYNIYIILPVGLALNQLTVLCSSNKLEETVDVCVPLRFQVLFAEIIHWAHCV